MINCNELRGRWVAKGMTQGEVAKALGIASKTLSLKMKKGILDSDEIEKLIELLEIQDPMKVFFVNKIPLKDTSK